MLQIGKALLEDKVRTDAMGGCNYFSFYLGVVSGWK